MPQEQTTPKQAEENADTRPFRQRIAEQLGPEYHGAERLRLDQDCRKERHWKRWGPYLSDRQWVRRRLPWGSYAGSLTIRGIGALCVRHI